LAEDTGKKTIAFKNEQHVKVSVNGNPKLSYTLGISSTIEGEILKSTLIWPTKGKRNAPSSN